MDEASEIKRLLKKNLEVSEESFKILRKMHRAQTMGRFFKVLKWVAVIALTLGAYYYIQPMIDTLLETFAQIKTDLSAVGETGQSIKDLPPDLLEKLKSTLKPR
jgi:cellulose synthase/poly-beta-1,6-N-acetylglucosamine synthase-like glycosyltransferase